MKLEGRCYCGNVRYVAEGEPVLKAQCHCRECQYITGGGPEHGHGHAGLTRFKYTQGAPKWFSRSDLERPVTREFCPDCGTHLVTKPQRPVVVVKVGTLDDPKQFGAPQMAIFTIDKQPFHQIPEGLQPSSARPVADRGCVVSTTLPITSRGMAGTSRLRLVRQSRREIAARGSARPNARLDCMRAGRRSASNVSFSMLSARGLRQSSGGEMTGYSRRPSAGRDRSSRLRRRGRAGHALLEAPLYRARRAARRCRCPSHRAGPPLRAFPAHLRSDRGSPSSAARAARRRGGRGRGLAGRKQDELAAAGATAGVAGDRTAFGLAPPREAPRSGCRGRAGSAEAVRC